MKKVFIWGHPQQVDPSSPLQTQFEQSGCNFGNLLIVHGAMSLFPRELLCFPKDFKRPEEVAEVCSHIVVPAANILWHGFDVTAIYEYLAKISLPIILLGVGAQTSNRNLSCPINETTMKLMRLASDRSSAIGVRGYYTAEMLAARGIHNTEILGCPSFYMKGKPSKIRTLNGGLETALSVNFSRPVNSHSFRPARLQQVENALLKYAMRYSAEFVAQDELEELWLSAGDERGLQRILAYFEGSAASDVRRFFAGKATYFTSPDLWSEYISGKTFSVGSRFHGNLIAVINGTPALFIVHDSRTMELCALLGVPYIHVEQNTERSIDEDFIAAAMQSADFGLFEKAHETLFQRMKAYALDNGLPIWMGDIDL